MSSQQPPPPPAGLSARPQPSQAQRVIHTPDCSLRVFVSSTLQELALERGAALQAVQRLRLTPVLFGPGARPHPPQEPYRAYLARVASQLPAVGTALGHVRGSARFQPRPVAAARSGLLRYKHVLVVPRAGLDGETWAAAGSTGRTLSLERAVADAPSLDPEQPELQDASGGERPER
jgi:hypothetical protein